jgi:hypothetical protein
MELKSSYISPKPSEWMDSFHWRKFDLLIFLNRQLLNFYVHHQQIALNTPCQAILQSAFGIAFEPKSRLEKTFPESAH